MTLDEITARLKQYEADPKMTTKSVYSPAATDYPDNQLPFVQVHLSYLRKHHKIDPISYLSNLEIMIKQK